MPTTNRCQWREALLYNYGAVSLPEGEEATAANLNNRGVAKLKTSRLSEAEADFKAAIDKDANLAHAYYNLAIVYAFRGLTDETVKHLDDAIRLNADLKSSIMTDGAFVVMRETPAFDKFR